MRNRIDLSIQVLEVGAVDGIVQSLKSKDLQGKLIEVLVVFNSKNTLLDSVVRHGDRKYCPKPNDASCVWDSLYVDLQHSSVDR